MVIRDNIFDVLVFGLLFVAPLIDRSLVTIHHYLTGTFTAAIMALFAYLSMWEIHRRSFLRWFRTQESLATAAAASTVGLAFCLQRNQYPLILLVLSVGFMMGALVVAISSVSCVVEWKLSSGEWTLAGLWALTTAAACAYLALKLALVLQAIWVMEGSAVLLCLALWIRQPRRLIVVLGMLSTLACAAFWGFLCSEFVLLGGGERAPVYTSIVAVAGAALWLVMRIIWPSSPNAAPAALARSAVWLGPLGLAVPAPETVSTQPLANSTTISSDESTMVNTVADGDVSAPQPEAPSEVRPESSPAAPAGQTPPPFVPIGVVLPGRLADRLAIPVLIAAILNHFLL